MNPKLSIVMPVYNAGRFLKETVDSILRQTYKDFELIAVDDGSTDESVSLLRSYEDSRIRIISQPNSGGPAKPRNIGVTASISDYICFFDSDDLMHREKLAASVDILEKHPKIGMVISDFSAIDENGAIVRASYLESYKGFQSLLRKAVKMDAYFEVPRAFFLDGLCNENFVGTSSVVMRRSVLDLAGQFDEQLRNSDDRDMWFRVAPICDVAYVPRQLHYYRLRADSISSRRSSINGENRLCVLMRQLKADVTPSQRKSLRRLVGENYSGLGYMYRSEGRRVASAKAFLRACRFEFRLRWILAACKSLTARNRGLSDPPK